MPLLTFITSTVVPAVFNPACLVTIDVSVFIAFLEFAGAVVPVTFITYKGIFNLLRDVGTLKLFKFIPSVESPVFLLVTIGVGSSAFSWENDVLGEVTIAPRIACLNNKAVHLNTINQKWESIKIED